MNQESAVFHRTFDVCKICSHVLFRHNLVEVTIEECPNCRYFSCDDQYLFTQRITFKDSRRTLDMYFNHTKLETGPHRIEPDAQLIALKQMEFARTIYSPSVVRKWISTLQSCILNMFSD